MTGENPSIVFFCGPLKGKTFVLSDLEVSIGREASNSLWVNGKLISRHDALIKAGSGHFSIFDLNSRNGTSVNGVPVKERRLEPGDRIHIGESLLLFVQGSSDFGSEVLTTAPVRFA